MLYIQSGKDGGFVMHTCRWFWKATLLQQLWNTLGFNHHPSTAIEILNEEGDKQAKLQEMVIDMVRKSVNLPTYSCQTKKEHP